MKVQHFDPAAVLGCSTDEAAELLAGRRVTPGEVEAVALAHYDWRRHLHDPRSYWVTTTQAARVLRLAPSTVQRLLDEGRLPHVRHRSGIRLLRRHEVVAVADHRHHRHADLPTAREAPPASPAPSRT